MRFYLLMFFIVISLLIKKDLQESKEVELAQETNAESEYRFGDIYLLVEKINGSIDDIDSR